PLLADAPRLERGVGDVLPRLALERAGNEGDDLVARPHADVLELAVEREDLVAAQRAGGVDDVSGERGRLEGERWEREREERDEGCQRGDEPPPGWVARHGEALRTRPWARPETRASPGRRRAA